MCSSDNDGDYNYNYSTFTFKKPKRQKVPKRGPGVAELEKILRDQNRKLDHPDTSSSLYSPSSPNSCHHYLHPQPPNFFSSTTFSHLNPTTTGNVTPTSAQIPSGYSFPITPLSKSNQNHMLQRKHSQMVKLSISNFFFFFLTLSFRKHCFNLWVKMIAG